MSYIGQHVVIIDDGYMYSSYEEAARKMNLIKFNSNHSKLRHQYDGIHGVVVAQMTHTTSKNITLLGVDIGDEQIIISTDKKAIKLFENLLFSNEDFFI